MVPVIAFISRAPSLVDPQPCMFRLQADEKDDRSSMRAPPRRRRHVRNAAGGEAGGPGGAPVGLPRRLPGGLLLRGEAARVHHAQAGHHQAPPPPRQQLTQIDLIHAGRIHICVGLFALTCCKPRSASACFHRLGRPVWRRHAVLIRHRFSVRSLPPN